MAFQVMGFPPQLLASFAGIPLNAGRTHAVSVDPRDRRRVIVSMQFGGLWKTTDGGDHWDHVDGLRTVFAVDVQHGPDGRTVVATLFWDNQTVSGGGIWVSRDGGSTWSRPRSGAVPTDARTPERTAAWGIAKAPWDDRTWYVGTDYGIAVSFDNGASWDHRRVDPASPMEHDKMQDSVRSVLAFPDGRVLAMVRRGIYRSDDRGTAWRLVRSGWFGFQEGAGWNKLDRSPYRPYAFVLQDYSTLLFYGLDSETWTALTLPGGGGSRSPFVRVGRAGRGERYITIWVGQGVRGLFATRRSATAIRALTPADWSIFGRGEGMHDDTGDLGLDGQLRPTMLGSDGGVFAPQSVDETGEIIRWRSAAPPGSGMNSYQITDIGGTYVGAPRFTTTLYFATQDNAIWASTDGGNTWPSWDCAEGFHIEVTPTARSSQKVTVGYGKIGCGPSPSMFSDPGLVNQRAVPDVDPAGSTLTRTSQAFYLTHRHWLRFRMPEEGPGEVRVSSDNGNTWRLRFTTTLGPRGPFQRSRVGRPPDRMMAHIAVATGENNPDGSARIGLLRLPWLMRNRIDALGEADVIELPDGGSLGVRATEFDWQAVFGAHPRDSRMVIAPDIVNGDVKITRNAGMTWTTNAQLTDLVTRWGSLLIYKGPYFMQVTHIGFDPYDDNRIMVGTRDAGIMASYDAGETWEKILGSERVLYCTGFFFLPDSTVVVCTYGRGLWRITQQWGCLSMGGAGTRAISAILGLVRGRRGRLREPAGRREESVEEGYVEPDDEELSEPTGRDYPERPRVVVSTTIVTMGTPVLGPDGVLDIWGKGFDPRAGTPTLLLDGDSLTYEGSEMRSDGTFSTRLTAPPDLPNGEHRIEIRQGAGPEGRATTATFVKAQIDDHLDEPSESRFVPQPLEPDEDEQEPDPYGQSGE